MGKYVAENVVKNMIKADKQIKGSTVVIFGITFKENCPDVRNTKVVDVIRELEEYGINVKVVDPAADKEDLWKTYGIKLYDMEEINDVDAIVFAVAHEEFKSMKLEDIKKMYNNRWNNYQEVIEEIAVTAEDNNKYVLIDVKGIFNRKEAENMNFQYWRL